MRRVAIGGLAVGLVTGFLFMLAGALPATAAPTVTLLSAQGMVPVGSAPPARATLSTPTPGLRATTEAWTGSAWSTSQIGVTDASGEFSLPLTYGRTSGGSFRFRLAVLVEGSAVYSREFTITRYSTSPYAYSAPGHAPVGTTAAVRARVQNTGSGATVRTQFLVSGRWSTSQLALTDAAGFATIPLTYGKTSAGTYSWRLIHTNSAGHTSVSGTYTLVRYGNGKVPTALLCQIPWARTGWRIACRALPAFTAMSNAYQSKFGRPLQVDHTSTPDANCYRTYEEQVRLRNLYLAGKGSYAAVPGTSNHGWGLACDINMFRATPTQPMHSSATYLWLQANAAKYGFANTVKSEDWHWVYTR